MTQAPENTGASVAVSPSPFWWRGHAPDSVQLGFTSIHAGNLARHAGPQQQVSADRRRLEAAMGVSDGSLRFLNQIHSAVVLDASATDTVDTGTSLTDAGTVADASVEMVPTGDAWVCADGSVPLAIMVADCLPVLFHGSRAGTDPAGRVPVTAAAHAGRPGLLGGVLENTVAAMKDRGAVTITAWIGPGACGVCYEIPAEMVAEVSRGRPAIASTTSWGTSALDLRAEAQAVLTRQGVAVEDLDGCTLEDESLFSHRRDPARGRFAGVIWVPAAAAGAGDAFPATLPAR